MGYQVGQKPQQQTSQARPCYKHREKLEARELESCLFEEGEVNEGGRRSTTTKMRDTEDSRQMNEE